jgi:uncharacterized damage-inducible protein DinB
MYTPDALRDIHERSHRSLAGLLLHCAKLAPGEIEQEMPGFGYASIRLQLHHVISAEEYWITVLQGRVNADDNAADFAGIPELQQYRARTAAATAAWLESATAAELNTPRKFSVWSPTGNVERTLMAAHVVLRSGSTA